MKTIYFNQDNQHFYMHPAADMTEEGVRNLVRYYAKTGTMKAILFCVNLQRALFDSNVWERFYNIPRTGVPGSDIYPDNLKRLSERKVDHFAIWLDECKKHDIEGWLTMRMNDCHGLGEAVANNQTCWLRHWHSEKWAEHPEFRRAPYRAERSWECAYNYGIEEVRDHHLALVRELFDRFDMFGLELDWMRWGMFFKPGFERESTALMTGFVREVRKLADAAEKKYGHPIRLAHRIPAEPAAAFDSGFDVPAWGREGMADMVTLSSFLCGTNYDPPMAQWRAMLPAATKINVYVEQVANAIPGESVNNYDLMLGAAAVAWSAGADGIYLFNECYRELNERALLEYVLTHIDSPEHLAGTVRRIAVSYPQVAVPGTSRRGVLPIPLTQPKIGADFGRMAQTVTVRLSAGKLEPGARCFLRLGFSEDTDMAQLKELEVRVNTRVVEPAEWPAAQGLHCACALPADLPPNAKGVLVRRVPAEILHETFNAVELLVPPVPGSLVWAELLVL